MSGNEKDSGSTRRRILLGAAGLVGGVAGVTVATPFLGSLRPSRKTLSAGKPVRVTISDISSGTLKNVIWRSKPVWIFGRSEEMLAQAKEEANLLLDPESNSSLQPDYCKNENRSIKPEIFVAIGLCTHLGCIPGKGDSSAFLCACHGSKFDVSGRVFKGSPAPSNLIVPPHFFEGDDLVIGEDGSSGKS